MYHPVVDNLLITELDIVINSDLLRKLKVKYALSECHMTEQDIFFLPSCSIIRKFIPIFDDESFYQCFQERFDFIRVGITITASASSKFDVSEESAHGQKSKHE